MVTLLFVLNYAVHQLRSSEFRKQKQTFVVEPIKSTVLERSLKLVDCTASRKANVYEKNGLVYKLLDVEWAGYAKPNVDVIKRILGDNYLCHIKVVKLSEDGHF